jgi:hypothetical protein
VHVESHPQAFGSRIARSLRQAAELRLVWDEKDEHLSLQISHGPSVSHQAGWLELFAAKCPGGVLVEAGESSAGLVSSIEYGVELMSPGGSQ